VLDSSGDRFWAFPLRCSIFGQIEPSTVRGTLLFIYSSGSWESFRR